MHILHLIRDQTKGNWQSCWRILRSIFFLGSCCLLCSANVWERSVPCSRTSHCSQKGQAPKIAHPGRSCTAGGSQVSISLQGPHQGCFLPAGCHLALSVARVKCWGSACLTWHLSLIINLDSQRNFPYLEASGRDLILAELD